MNENLPFLKINKMRARLNRNRRKYIQCTQYEPKHFFIYQGQILCQTNKCTFSDLFLPRGRTYLHLLHAICRTLHFSVQKAIWAVKFRKEEQPMDNLNKKFMDSHKIRQIFGLKSTYSREIIVFCEETKLSKIENHRNKVGYLSKTQGAL